MSVAAGPRCNVVNPTQVPKEKKGVKSFLPTFWVPKGPAIDSATWENMQYTPVVHSEEKKVVSSTPTKLPIVDDASAEAYETRAHTAAPSDHKAGKTEHKAQDHSSVVYESETHTPADTVYAYVPADAQISKAAPHESPADTMYAYVPADAQLGKTATPATPAATPDTQADTMYAYVPADAQSAKPAENTRPVDSAYTPFYDATEQGQLQTDTMYAYVPADEKGGKSVDDDLKKPAKSEQVVLQSENQSERAHEQSGILFESPVAGVEDAGIMGRLLTLAASETENNESYESVQAMSYYAKNTNWNEMYQKALDLPHGAQKLEAVSQICTDFAYAATMYGKIIISEFCLPDEQKSIKRASMGGMAGGDKYICHGILFKFGLDVMLPTGQYLYGKNKRRDDLAMKAASNEFRAYQIFLTSSAFRIPLSVLIDHQGYRLTAIALLPIDSGTLRYGCADRRMIKNSDEEIERLIKEMALFFHIRGHEVRTITHSIFMHGAADLEAHRGRDGYCYVVDLARYFPPEAPASAEDSSSIFYKIFRPGFMIRYHTPLNPDTFSGWLRVNNNDEKREEKIKEVIQDEVAVRKATKYLHEVTVPEVAEGAEKIWKHQLTPETAAENEPVVKTPKDDIKTCKFHLSQVPYYAAFVQGLGVNMRYLGEVRHHTKDVVLRRFILSQCVARVCKTLLREKWRQLMTNLGFPTQEPFLECAGVVLPIVVWTN